MVLFYLWLAVSVVVLVQRLVSRKQRKAPMARSASSDPLLPVDWAPPAQDPVAPPTPPPPGPERAARPAPRGAGAPPGPTAPSLIEALAGISLPCDLMPLTSAEGHDLGNRELLLITSGHSGFEVGRALGEAMAALGYTLTPMANYDMVATRAGDRVSVVIHERPEGMLAGKRQAFPTAKPGDVVVELHL